MNYVLRAFVLFARFVVKNKPQSAESTEVTSVNYVSSAFLHFVVNHLGLFRRLVSWCTDSLIIAVSENILKKNVDCFRDPARK